MRRSRLLTSLFFVLGVSRIPMAEGQASYPFDGVWVINLACPRSTDGAEAFSWQFPGTAKGGVFHGERGISHRPGWIQLDGQIKSDGSAAMIAEGITGNSAYNLKNAPTGIPYHYPVTATFNGARGSGTWTTKRICTFRFEKL
jgi:hypothetical protein